MKKLDLEQWDIVDPQKREDSLPQPYGLISEALKETILHKLDLAMFQIEQKKKDSNYEGSVKDYFSQNSIDIPAVACISDGSNSHNHLLAGDKNGTLLLLDLAKKVVFSKKQLHPGRRVLHIAESLLSDGQVTFTSAAVVLNSHPKVYLLRYRHGEQKLLLSHEIAVCDNADEPLKLPFRCQWEEYSRLLFVYTYGGDILLYRVPQLSLDLDSVNRNQTIPLEEQEFRKRLRYPLNYARLDNQCSEIKDTILQIKFPGKKTPRPGKDGAEGSSDLEMNLPIQPRQVVLENGQDNTPAYPLPRFRPYLFTLYRKVDLPKKKEFERGRYIDIAERVLFGWTHLREFSVAHLLLPKPHYCPDFLFVQHNLVRPSESFTSEKRQYLGQEVTLKHRKVLKCLDQVRAVAVSQQDQVYFAAGLANGATSVWSTNSLNILMNTRKHRGSVTCLSFFENWKLVSGSSKGELNIDNIQSKKNEVSRTNTFEPRVEHPIISLRVSPLGVAFALDQNGCLRGYDLWRDQKIAKLHSCNNFAVMENKARRWLGSSAVLPAPTLYTNNDFTAVISTNWPSYTPHQVQESPSKQAQVHALTSNPWKCRATNLHVVRNFEFLFNLFEGLEVIYKKGYDRRKVENLFSNLEFTQLNNRNFDIPDFGVGSNPFKKATQPRFNQSSKSRVSSKSRERLMKESSSGASQAKQPLTNEALHPQRFLLERRKVGGQEVLTDEILQGHILQAYRRQGALESALNSSLSKGIL